MLVVVSETARGPTSLQELREGDEQIELTRPECIPEFLEQAAKRLGIALPASRWQPEQRLYRIREISFDQVSFVVIGSCAFATHDPINSR